ncbi:hypothetical protein [Roseimicrobium sp. ORNL1]|uniref:hypothetical protein n=1 Tax=Roseimicrobium sp. ORNL1 TaxID=2711231 RepID=UPI0013E1B15B|nr:hypothetical protein [Roseimicrobium sp. ORNL1]QIF02851.1 hypothetical protein G5S37_15420 [Roseimicrobium sp. ORNL1]
MANLAAHLVASNILAPPPHLVAGDRRECEFKRIIDETLAFTTLCADALHSRSERVCQTSERQAIAASAEKIKTKAYEASHNMPNPTKSALAGIGEDRSWESLSNDAKSAARKRLARAPIGEFLQEANVSQMLPTEKELGSIGEKRSWASIPQDERSNSIFRILTNHMVELGSDQIPALSDATITEYGTEGVPVEIAETILWHLKVSNDDRQSVLNLDAAQMRTSGEAASILSDGQP